MSIERQKQLYSYVVMDVSSFDMGDLDDTEDEIKPTPRAFYSSTYGLISENENFSDNASTFFPNGSWSPDMGQNSTFVYNFYFYETVQFAVMWLLFIAIVAGNSSVIAALLLSKSRKSRMNYFIMQLAIADLSVGLISVLTDIIQKMTITWTAGNVTCKLVQFLRVVVTYSSTYVLVALSIDRCDAITHPMNFTGSRKRAKALIVTAWLLSAIFSMPMLVLYEEALIQDKLQCWIDLGSPHRWQVYMLCVLITLFVLPALTITACYTVIVFTIWTKSKIVMSPTSTSKRLKNNNRIVNTDDLNTRRASSRGLIPRAKIKTVKMTFVIVFVFILCWSPYMVFDLLQVYDWIPHTQKNVAIATLIQSLAPLNSAANPIIYCIFSTHIFKSLKKMPPFKWLCCVRDRRGSRGAGEIGGGGAHGAGIRTHGAGGTLRSNTDSTTVSEMLTSSRRRRSTLLRQGSNQSNELREATGMTILNNSVKRFTCKNSDHRHSLLHDDSCRSLTVGFEEPVPSKHVQLVLPAETNSK